MHGKESFVTEFRPQQKQYSYNPADVVEWVSDYRNAVKADTHDRMRFLRNLAVYTGIDGQMLPDAIRLALRSQGRQETVYNFVQMILGGHIGNYLMSGTDPKFMDSDADKTDAGAATNFAQRLYFKDKEHGGYNEPKLRKYEAGLLMSGTEEITIDQETANPRDWRIKFVHRRTDLVTYDKNCASNNISRDSRRCWAVSFMSPHQMLQLSPDSGPDIVRALAKSEGHGEDEYQEIAASTFSDISSLKKFAGTYPVVEDYSLDCEYVDKQLYVMDDASIIVLPDTGFKVNSSDDIAAKTEWAMRKGFQINGERVFRHTDHELVLYRRTYCDSLGVVFFNGKDLRQIKRIPFYDWSFLSIAGMRIGLLDFLIDPHTDINKRLLAKTKAIELLPGAGKWAVSEDNWDGDIKKKQEMIADLSDSSKPWVTPSGIPLQMSLQHIQGPQVNQALLQDSTEKIQMLFQIGRLPPAKQGQTGNSAESGVGLTKKIIEGDIMNGYPTQTFIYSEHEKAEGWLALASTFYAGPVNYKRTFNGKDGDTLVVNDFLGYNEDGQEIVVNDVSDLKRSQVTIVESKENSYLKQAQRQLDIDALAAMQPTPMNGGVRAMFETSLAEKMDIVDEAEKAAVSEACALTRKLAVLSLQVQIKQAEAALQPPPPQQATKPPSTQISFKDLPPEGRAQLAAQAGIQLSPENTAAPGELPPAPGSMGAAA